MAPQVCKLASTKCEMVERRAIAAAMTRLSESGSTGATARGGPGVGCGGPICRATRLVSQEITKFPLRDDHAITPPRPLIAWPTPRPGHRRHRSHGSATRIATYCFDHNSLRIWRTRRQHGRWGLHNKPVFAAEPQHGRRLRITSLAHAVSESSEHRVRGSLLVCVRVHVVWRSAHHGYSKKWFKTAGRQSDPFL